MSKTSQKQTTTILLCTLLLFLSCKQTTTNTIPPNTNTTNTIPNRIELPQVKNKQWFIQHTHYAMEYDTAQRHAIWVAYVFHEDYNKKSTQRTDKWAFDPQIPKEYQSLKNKSQTYPAYDRGHLIASEDRVFSKSANEETFYFSNISPQLGWFNQQIWKNLEEKVRQWAKATDCDTLYVVTGGAINKGVEVIGKLPERNNVTIPKYYYKALIKRKGNTFHGIAFWLENKRHQTTKITHQHALTIRELEQKTKIDFFPNLKHVLPQNPNLEETVETKIDLTKWEL